MQINVPALVFDFSVELTSSVEEWSFMTLSNVRATHGNGFTMTGGGVGGGLKPDMLTKNTQARIDFARIQVTD